MYALVGLLGTLFVVSSFAQVFAQDPNCEATAQFNDFVKCCKLPMSEVEHLDFNNLKDADVCRKELNHTGLSTDSVECLQQCTMKKSGTLDENNVLHAEFVVAKLKDHLLSTDAWYQPLLDGWENCVELTNTKLDYLKEVQSKRVTGVEDNCVPTVEFLTSCFQKALFGKCPVSERQGDEDCEALHKFYGLAEYPELKKYFKFQSKTNNFCDVY